METTKQVILDTGNSWILEMKVYKVGKEPAKISERGIEKDNLY